MISQLVDRIYEAAFLPEFWPGVLDDMAALSNSVSGSVLVFSGPDQPPIYQTTDYTRESLHAFTTTNLWRESRRAEVVFKNMASGDYSRFHYLSDEMTADEIAGDSVTKSLRELDIDVQVTTLIPLLSGEIVTFTFERLMGDGRHSSEALNMLDAMRPHLARSGMVGARLRLERAEATVSTLKAIGMPAAVLQANGNVLSTNTLFDEFGSMFVPLAFGRLALSDAGADQLFREALDAARHTDQPVVRSIPVVARENAPACVLHVVPLCRSAHDIFSSGDLLVAVTTVAPGKTAPPAALLSGLFDLSPSEVKLAMALISGASINDAAIQSGVTVKTARTYLERIFSKTGMHRQSDLIALLKSAQLPG